MPAVIAGRIDRCHRSSGPGWSRYAVVPSGVMAMSAVVRAIEIGVPAYSSRCDWVTLSDRCIGDEDGRTVRRYRRGCIGLGAHDELRLPLPRWSRSIGITLLRPVVPSVRVRAVRRDRDRIWGVPTGIGDSRRSYLWRSVDSGRIIRHRVGDVCSLAVRRDGNRCRDLPDGADWRFRRCSLRVDIGYHRAAEFRTYAVPPHAVSR